MSDEYSKTYDSLGKKLELKPFLEYDHNYTSEDQKGKGRIRIADGSRNLIKSVLDDLGA